MEKGAYMSKFDTLKAFRRQKPLNVDTSSRPTSTSGPNGSLKTPLPWTLLFKTMKTRAVCVSEVLAVAIG